MTELLLVEDDSSLGETLKERLEKEGYKISWHRTASAARAFFEQQKVDGAIIDIGLPDGDGFTLARDFRASYTIPILFLTAMNSAEYRLEAYELGATDYIPKPFHLKELLLRLEKVFASSSEPIVSGDLRLQSKKMEVASLKNPELTKQIALRDFELLLFFIRNESTIISREEILQQVWKGSDGSHPRTVDNAVVRLRHLLRELDSSNQIHSVRGAGYQWKI